MRRGTQGFDYFLAAPLVGPDDLIWDASYLTDMMARWSGAGESELAQPSKPNSSGLIVCNPFSEIAPNRDNFTPTLQQLLNPPGPQRVDEGGGDVIPQDSSTTFTLTLGVAETGTVNHVFDRDWFRIELVEGQSYEFTLNASGASPLSDPYLEIVSPFGSVMSLDDDGGPGLNARMQYTALSTGTYYLSARGFDTALGDYTITANLGPPQNPLDTIDLEYTAPSFIEVYFVPAGGAANPFGDAPLRSWTAAEIDAAMAALATYAAVTPLVFVQTATRADAEFVLTLANLQPGELGHFGTVNGIGYGAFAPAASGWATGLHPGGRGFSTLLHEFGHGLGLAHPHHDGGDVQVMQGVTQEFNDWGDFQMNQGVYTVMSYNDGYHGSGSATSGHQATPAPLDIALLQQRYGANPTANAGDTTYTIEANFRTIWDTGGIDTIVNGDFPSSWIDLRAATLQNEDGGGGFVTRTSGVQVGGFTIAAGVVIENAIGNANTDRITGNHVDNVLEGRGDFDFLWGEAGDDTLFGGDGDDTIEGGIGEDTLIGDAGNDFIDGGAGADAMTGGAGGDHYIVDDVADVVTEFANESGADRVTTLIEGYVLIDEVENLGLGAGVVAASGNSLDNQINGNDLDNIIDGGPGADNFHDTFGNDTYIFDNENDRVFDQNSGYDIVQTSALYTSQFIGIEEIQMLAGAVSVFNGGAHTGITVFGNAADNQITGGGGADQFFGGDGNDTLNGGVVVDTLDGGAGDDTIVWEWGGGADLIDGGDGADTLNVVDNNDPHILNASYDGAELVSVADLSTLTNIETVNADMGAGTDWLIYAAASAAVAVNLATGSASGFTSITGVERVIGGDGNDTITGDALDNRLDGGAGDDALAGGGGVDTLIGGDGADTLAGGLANDSLQGGIGADTFGWAAGEGRDTIDGGADTDTFNATGAGVAELGQASWNGSSVTALMDNALTSIEAINLDLAGGIDWLIYSTSFGVTVDLGTNAASGFASVSNIEKVIGGSGGDALTGDGLDNRLDGQGGNDTLNGGAGSDAVLGGDGDDIIFASAGNDSLQGLNGNDTFYWVSTDGRDTFSGGAGTDTVNLTGSAVADVADTNWNGSTITGLLNNALVDIETVNLDLGGGGPGGDWLRYNTSSAISVDLGAGTATGFASIAGVENLIGGTGGDALTGDANANKINANNGDDTITGGAGNDNLIGGLGNDTFVYSAGAGADTIVDFDAWNVGGQDLIDVTGFGITAGDFASRVAIIDTGADTVVRIDGDVFITLKNVSGDGDNVITGADFILA